MVSPHSEEPVPRKRGKGRPAVIDREKILEAARRLPADALTMQAVANELGVDPTALNYHVGGRSGLLRMAAVDRMRAAIDEGALADVEGDWKDVLRAFAVITRNAVASMGSLGGHLDWGTAGLVPFLEIIEIAIGALKDAGFDTATAGRAIGVVAHNAVIAGRARSEGLKESPEQVERFFAQVAERAGETMPNIADLIGLMMSNRGEGGRERENDEQFDFSLDVTIAGLEALLGR